MQVPKISKLFPALCAAVFCTSLVVVRAADTPAQAAARAALLQKLNEMPSAPSAPPVAVTASNAVVEAPAPVVVAPPVAPTPAPAPAPAQSTEMFLPAPAPATAASPAVDSDAQAKARAAVLQKLSELQQQPVATPPPAPEKVMVKAIEKPTPVAAPVIVENKPPVVAEPVVKPIETPALPIAATKEERLQALLAKYKADLITPAEYHTERAKIIAEP
jgi:hypothetical protein